MLPEKSNSELWLAIRELYKWRRGLNSSWSGIVFDRLEQSKDKAHIKANCPALFTAYEMWKAHSNEDAFFLLNHFKPEVSEP